MSITGLGFTPSNVAITRKAAFSGQKESASSVLVEMQKNVPDRTTTIPQKNLALSYIERILNSDADKDTKTYWNNKSIVIQQEIALIERAQGENPALQKEPASSVWAEMQKNVPDRTTTIPQKNLALSYIERILYSDADKDTKEFWRNKAITIQGEIKRMQPCRPPYGGNCIM